MKPLAASLSVTMWLALATTAAAHPAPFSYVDVHVGADAVEITIVAHIFDVAHDLNIAAQERLLDPAFSREGNPVAALLGPRVQLSADGVAVKAGEWTDVEPLPDRQAVRIRARYPMSRPPGVLAFEILMFPYDPAHQTFVNVYEAGSLMLQAILDSGKRRLEFYPGSREGTMAVLRRFAPAGARHVLLGADHLMFFAGLLLLGGPAMRVAGFAGALAAANGVALLLTTLRVFQPPARLIEPAIALTIVFMGVDNLMVRGGRDMRTWIAGAFGLIHGFWFANGLLASDLPRSTLGWSLFSFDAGVELANVVGLAGLGYAVWAVRSRTGAMSERVVRAGSMLVVASGVYWFVQRVFFAGGLT
jgi:hypothetical protein